MLPSLKGGKVVREVRKRNGQYLVYAQGHDDHVVNFAPKKFRLGHRQADLPGRHKTVDAAVAAIDKHYKSGEWRGKSMLHVIDETILKAARKVWSRQCPKCKGSEDILRTRNKCGQCGTAWPEKSKAEHLAEQRHSEHYWGKKEKSLHADLFKGSDESRKWALTNSIWGRLSPSKQTQYLKHAKPRVEKKLGRKLKLKDMRSRPPQEFHDRIHHGYLPPWHNKKKSLESEFGPLVADVVKAFQAVLESENLEKGERPWSRDQHHSAARFHDSKADSFQLAAEKAGHVPGNRPTPQQGRLLRLSNQHNEAFHAHKDAAAERSAWRQKKLSGVARTMSAKINKIKG